jgi:O-antigen ligase
MQGHGAARETRRELEAQPDPEALPSSAGQSAPPYLLWAIILFFVLEYARPPVVVSLKLQMLILLVLPVAWAFGSARVWDRILTAQLLFFLLNCLHVPIAYNYFSAYMLARAAFGNFVMAVALAWELQRLSSFRVAIVAWILIMAYGAIFGLTHGGRGPGGFMGDENDLAVACCTALAFAFFGFEYLSGWKKYAALGLAIVFVTSIVVSFSRGGFVGLVVVVAYCFVASRRKGRSIVVFAVSIAAFFALAPQKYIDEIKTLTDTSGGTVETRRFLWDTAYNMWRDYPLIGVGGGNFTFLAGEYQPRGGAYQKPEYLERNWSGTTVHSLYFELLSEMGIAGVILFAVVVGGHFRLLIRLRRDVLDRTTEGDPLQKECLLYARALMGAMVGYLAPGAFVSVLYYPYPWYLSALAVAADRSIRAELEAREASAPTGGDGADPEPGS